MSIHTARSIELSLNISRARPAGFAQSSRIDRATCIKAEKPPSRVRTKEPVAHREPPFRGPVGGHENLNGGGQESERWRSRKLNGRGQEICFVQEVVTRAIHLGSLRVVFTKRAMGLRRRK
jgi:hypothetical protein